MKTKITIPASAYKRLTDEELIRRYKELHEHGCMNFIFERYAHIVYGICLKQLGDTVAAKSQVETIFIKMLGVFEKTEITDFKPWLLHFVLESCQAPSPPANEALAMENYNDHIAISAGIESGSLERSLEHLTTAQKKCVQLFYLDNKNHAEVSKETGLTIHNVRQLLHGGTVKLIDDLKTCKQ